MCFEILGFDIIIDDQLKAFLLEVNHAPSLNSDTQFDIKNKGDLLRETFKLLGINLANRKDIIQETKNQFEQWQKFGKFKSLSKEEKTVQKDAFRKRFDDYEKECSWFEWIHPLNIHPWFHEWLAYA